MPEIAKLLLQLDLEATPELCRAGLAWVEHEFASAYRPTPDNPLPYSDLVERLGIGHPLMAVQWFALQRCDAEKELSEAESLTRAYGDAPQRAEIGCAGKSASEAVKAARRRALAERLRAV